MFILLPDPSWPKSLLPQQDTLPPDSRAQVWPYPALMPMAPVKQEIRRTAVSGFCAMSAGRKGLDIPVIASHGKSIWSHEHMPLQTHVPKVH